MPSDYAAICEANRAEYGNVGRWGRDVLVNRYDSSAHFIFEILQNAEDALKRRAGWTGSRGVRFDLSADALRITHYGNPFSILDVKGVCGVGETTKDLTDIGRFGIGFKSVYSITERPQVHSGEEHFAIESFVFPTPVTPIARDPNETVFLLPLRDDDPTVRASIADGLSALGPRTLLFLRQIEEIVWSVEGGSSGLYLKGTAEAVRPGCRRVSIIGERDGQPIDDEAWLLFSREIHHESGESAGHAEIGFLLGQDDDGGSIRPLESSPLVAFFPTVVATNLGFLVQGPYRTTPSRDNIPPRDPWNMHLVAETADLLVEALEALKADGRLDVAALQSLPLERSKFAEGSMFAPLFTAVQAALSTRPLLPRDGSGWVKAAHARLARTQDLRELFEPSQLGLLLGEQNDIHWLTGEITRDTASSLRSYLLRELKVAELTPELILPKLTRSFLEAQSDEWIVRLYEFLAGKSALVRQGKAAALPLVRLENGTHTRPEADGQPQAFLPSAIKTDFPMVCRSVCGTTKAIEFLRALGLTEPDAVDDVVRNLLPKYAHDTVDVEDDEYAADIRRILNAFDTQHRGQREKLVASLREATFVMSVDLGDEQQYISKPDDLYLATERLTALLAGVPGAMVVDDSYECLRGKDARELLEACGVSRSLVQESVDCALTWTERETLRRASGCENATSQDPIQDHTLRCLPQLLKKLPALDIETRRARAELLWEALKDVEERRGTGAFSTSYSWFYYRTYRATFDSDFVRKLNSTAWVTDAEGQLQRPEFVTLESLGWTSHPFLASKIIFKKPIVEQLAVEAGIEPKLLDLLKKRGLTTVDELIAVIGDAEETGEPTTEQPTPTSESIPGDGPTRDDAPGSVDEALKSLLGGAPAPSPSVPDLAANDPVGAGRSDVSGRGGAGAGAGAPSGSAGSPQPQRQAGGTESNHGAPSRASQSGEGSRQRTPGHAGGRPFISYVSAHPNDEDPDPDGLEQDVRTALEEQAIAYILKHEPDWQRTEKNNPGFDLFQAGPDGGPFRWCEVKAMTGCLTDRPVGISRTQFDCAREHGSNYWLYVVEHAGHDKARIVRIQDPAGKARTFTFDHGWVQIADVSDPIQSGNKEGEP